MPTPVSPCAPTAPTAGTYMRKKQNNYSLPIQTPPTGSAQLRSLFFAGNDSDPPTTTPIRRQLLTTPIHPRPQYSLIQFLIPHLHPKPKQLPRGLHRLVDKGDPPLPIRQIDLPVNKRIVKPRLRRLMSRSRIHHPPRPRPIQCPKTHRTRLTGRIHIAIGKLEIPQPLTRIPDRNYFRMSRRIVAGRHPITPLPHNLPIPDDHTTKRPPHPLLDPLPRQRYRLLQIQNILFSDHIFILQISNFGKKLPAK